jgi:hypothetical protein
MQLDSLDPEIKDEAVQRMLNFLQTKEANVKDRPLIAPSICVYDGMGGISLHWNAIVEEKGSG